MKPGTHKWQSHQSEEPHRVLTTRLSLVYRRRIGMGPTDTASMQSYHFANLLSLSSTQQEIRAQYIRR